MEHERGVYTNGNWYAWNDSQKIRKGAGRVRNGRTDREHKNYSIAKIDQKTEKRPEDVRKVAATQSPVKDRQLNFVWKNA